MKLNNLLRLALSGGPGFCQIALTNACNARCRFCGFSRVPAQEWVMADPAGLQRGLSSLQQANLQFVSFTGGEPLLYPHLLSVLDHARQLALTTMVCTNGALLTPALIQAFAAAGLHTLIISVDAAAADLHDSHRGFPGLTAHIRDMLPLLHRAGLRTAASVTLSRLVDDLGALTRFVADLGFTRLTFSYPLTSLHSSYLGYSTHESVSYSNAELDRLFDDLKTLKSRAPLRIFNPGLSWRDLQRQWRRRPPRFPCLAGYKYFFVDWHLKVYPCHFLAQTLGVLPDIHRLTPLRNSCQACAIDCYRDASVMQYFAVSLADARQAWRQGHWRQALKGILHPYNILSLAAVLEGRHWVR